MAEARSRELAEWIRKERFPKFVNIKRFQESRLMSMRCALTRKTSDEHPQGRKAKTRIGYLGISIQGLSS